MNKHLVFVYGTLKQGFGNNVLLKDAKYIGRGNTKDKFFMLTQGFPVLFKGDEAYVNGEVYEVDDTVLSRLDRLESNGSMYVRTFTDIVVGNSIMPCQTYLGVEDFWKTSIPHLHHVPVKDGVYNWSR